MSKKIVIVDGYNVVHKAPALRARLKESLESARGALAMHCAEWKAARRDVIEVLLVFDGDSSVGGLGATSSRGVRTIFSESHENADSRIVSLVENAKGVDYVVVSDDIEVVAGARGRGARQIMSALEFCAMPRARAGRKIARDTSEQGGKRLTPDQQRQIDNELRRVWGLG